MESSSSSYWEYYYSTHREPSNCSLFAEFVLPFLQNGMRLMELGCGNARDSIYFAQHGINVFGIDQCKNEIKYLSNKFKEISNLTFWAGDMTDLSEFKKSDYLYSRFTIHAIDLEAEKRLLKSASNALKSNGLFFVEVRSVKDELFGKGTPLPDHAFFTDHYRRFIVLDELKERFKSNGFNILYSRESRGFAPFKTEDPVVIRVIAQKI